MDYRDDHSSGHGVVVLETEDRRVTEYDMGDGRVLRKTESLIDDALFEHNRDVLNENQGKRWGDGQIAASVPLNVFYDKLAPAVKQGDRAYIKKFLNDHDNRRFRTFPGQI